jgi:protein ImuB
MKTLRELYACIAVREFAAQAMLRLRPELRTQACVVLDGAPPLEAICAMNMRAQKQGLTAGMTRAEAETFPTTILVRSKSEEQTARAALLSCAAHFTPRVEECGRGTTYLCVLDIAGTTQLFGAPQKLAADLLERLRAVGLAATIAIAANYHTARCLALARNSGFCMIPAGQERAALVALPLAVLDLTEQQATTFSGWGIHSLGELAALPEAQLVARMGQSAKHLRQLALGTAPHLFVPLEESLALEEKIELDTPVDLLDSLLFVLRVLLARLLVRAVNDLVALAAVIVTLKLEGGSEHVRTVRPALPGTDLHLWMKLVQLDLAAHPPQAAILALTLAAEAGSRSKVQLGLFTPQAPEPDRLDVTLARLRSLVGDDCVGMPVLQDTHRPDAFKVEPFRVSAMKSDSAQIDSTATARGALRALRPPESLNITLQDKAPRAFVFRAVQYRVERAYGPWIASGDWWNPTLWAMQQWDVIARNSAGELLYCCVTFEPIEKIWQMVGLYD